MKIAGIQKFTLTDYPGEIACVIFLSGCNLRCPWCHNPELVFNNEEIWFSEEEVKTFLERYKGKLTGVVISGGEPTIWRLELYNLIKMIKDLGFKVKLDTNGSDSEQISHLLHDNLLDYVGLDLKCTIYEYKWMSPNKVIDFEREWVHTLMSCQKHNIPVEIRTTVVDGYFDLCNMREMARFLQENGVEHWILQPFHLPPDGVLDKSLTRGYIHKSQLEIWRKIVMSNLKGEKPLVIDLESRYPG